MVGRKEVRVVIVVFKNELMRFRSKYLEHYFASYGVRVKVINGEEPKDGCQELMEDLITLV